MPIVTFSRLSMAYGHVPLLDEADLQVEAGERIAVIGRNGTGKSTLMRLLNAEIEPDGGSIWRAPGLRSARLDQDVPVVSGQQVFDVVASGLGDLGELVKDYHRAAKAVPDAPTDEALSRLGSVQHQLDERDGWRSEERVELIIERLGLPADQIVDTLSGGWRRRVLLAQALVGQPDLLLLDEPTNHLDIDAIAWLEDFLAEYAGSVVFVTHDRSFLRRLATRTVELDRGRLTSWPGSYDTFLEKKEAWLANEALQNDKFDKRLAEEEVWLRQGIKARRTRNEGRVKALMAMRAERAARRNVIGQVRLAIDTADRSGHVVFEAEDMTFAYDGKPVVRDFSTRITRRDRIGLVGPNGVGKTTMLRLLVGDLKPTSGDVERGTNLHVAYFDQQREQLDPDRTVVDTVADGNDTVEVNGQRRHVHGYLRDFLFAPERARSPVRALSGGERNRLLLARLFTRPANVLILDEPTNDLDLETLELLEAELVAFPGTILVVSHDRAFLDNVVTSIFAFEGDGRVVEYVGGYEDWVRQRPASRRETTDRKQPPAVAAPAATPAGTSTGGAGRRGAPKLSQKQQRELAAMTATIESIESGIQALEARLSSPEIYREPAAAIAEAMTALDRKKQELSAAYAKWERLEEGVKT